MIAVLISKTLTQLVTDELRMICINSTRVEILHSKAAFAIASVWCVMEVADAKDMYPTH